MQRGENKERAITRLSTNLSVLRCTLEGSSILCAIAGSLVMCLCWKSSARSIYVPRQFRLCRVSLYCLCLRISTPKCSSTCLLFSDSFSSRAKTDSCPCITLAHLTVDELCRLGCNADDGSLRGLTGMKQQSGRLQHICSVAEHESETQRQQQ